MLPVDKRMQHDGCCEPTVNITVKLSVRRTRRYIYCRDVVCALCWQIIAGVCTEGGLGMSVQAVLHFYLAVFYCHLESLIGNTKTVCTFVKYTAPYRIVTFNV